MTPRSDADAPSLDRGLLARLKRLDPNLLVTWRQLAIDPLTDGPIVIKDDLLDPMTGDVTKAGPLVSPSFHLWRKDDYDGRYYYVCAYGVTFGHRQVASLEADLARHLDPAEIPRLIREAAQRRREAKQRSGRDDVAALTRANWRKIRESWDGKADTRGAKITSAPGLNRRSTSFSDIPLTPKEAGWESPDRSS